MFLKGHVFQVVGVVDVQMVDCIFNALNRDWKLIMFWVNMFMDFKLMCILSSYQEPVL